MKKSQLIEAVSIKAGMSRKDTEEVLQAFMDFTTETLQNGGRITLTGFGTFSAKERASRGGVDPRDPSKRIQIPAVIVPKFKAGKTLKDSLKKKKENKEEI